MARTDADLEDPNLKNTLVSYDCCQGDQTRQGKETILKVCNFVLRVNYENTIRHLERLLHDYHDLFGDFLLILKAKKDSPEFISETSIAHSQEREEKK